MARSAGTAREPFTYYKLTWRDAAGNVVKEYETQDPDDAEFEAGEILLLLEDDERLELTKEVF